jgi:hypothetical protein
MSFEVYYRSTRPVEPAEAEAIEESAGRLCDRDWQGWEPVRFYGASANGSLFGGCKPDCGPHRARLAAGQQGPPTAAHCPLLNVLSQLSREYGIDWEFSHDHSKGPIGYIRGGTPDKQLVAEIDSVLASIESMRQSRTSDGPND